MNKNKSLLLNAKEVKTHLIKLNMENIQLRYENNNLHVELNRLNESNQEAMRIRNNLKGLLRSIDKMIIERISNMNKHKEISYDDEKLIGAESISNRSGLLTRLRIADLECFYDNTPAESFSYRALIWPYSFTKKILRKLVLVARRATGK